MNLQEKLINKANEAKLSAAKMFKNEIKQSLVSAAEEGHTRLSYKIEQEQLHLYSSDLFISYLKSKLEGVDVKYEIAEFKNLFFPDRTIKEHRLIFTW